MNKNKLTFDEIEDSKERRWKLGDEALDSGDAAGAMFIFKSLANEGESDAMLYVASMYDIGKGGIEQDYGQARIWYERALLVGAEDEIASLRLGCIYHGGLGVNVDYKKAFKYFSAIKYGDQPAARFMLGCMYQKGHGVDRNIEKASSFFNEAMKEGHLLAASSLSKIMMKNNQFFDGLSLFLKTLKATYKVAIKDENDWRIKVDWKPTP